MNIITLFCEIEDFFKEVYFWIKINAFHITFVSGHGVIRAFWRNQRNSYLRCSASFASGNPSFSHTEFLT